MADISVLVAKITFVVAEIIFKEHLITSSMAKLTFVVDEITFQSGCDHFFGGKYNSCALWWLGYFLKRL